MYRYAINDITSWANQTTPKPLIIRGARQVGKSTLVHLLAKELDLDLIEINLENRKLTEVENENSFSIDKLISEIEVATRQNVNTNSLIFLDEIQAQPKVLSKLRYFYEDRPGLRIVAAGSLLEVAMEREKFPMPVGRVDYRYLGPMSFTEFLLALGDQIILEQIKEISSGKLPSKTLHGEATKRLREYMYVGGMPEAVDKFTQTGDMWEVRDVHRILLQTYRDDVPKYATGSKSKTILEVFDRVSNIIGKKVIFRELSNQHSSLVKDAISLLAQAHILYEVPHTNASGIPLKAGLVKRATKLFCLDVGLYNALMELEWEELYQIPADQILTKGAMAEQFIAQHLVYRKGSRELSPLYYWLRDAKKRAAEVDFILSHHGVIVPIEVKAGKTGKMRSLWQLLAEKPKIKKALRFDLSQRKSISQQVSHKLRTRKGIEEVQCELIGLPIYSVESLEKTLESFL